jgi:hypothetical protein
MSGSGVFARDDGQLGGGWDATSLLKCSKFDPAQPTFERIPQPNQ